MTLQVINSTTAGATQDLSTRVFMASDRLGLPPFSITQNAEEGSIGMSTLVVDDSPGTLTLKGHRRVYFVETAAPVGQQVIGNTYVGTKTIERGDWVVGPLARTFTVQLADANTLIGRRLMVGADADRPAETDVARVLWLQGTTEANEFNGSTTYIDTTGPVAMDAVDYRGQSVNAILNDCSQASHKNYWIIYEESLGEFSLWYDWDYSEVYDSTIRLSNDEADIDDSVTFAYFPTSTLTQDPSRVYSGTLIDFQPASTETTSWIYETNVATGNEFVFRDVSYSSQNVKTEAKARARAIKYNNESDEEDDVIHVSFVVPAASVNAYMHGMRIQVKGTHWGFADGNSYTDFTWMRGLNRTVTQVSSTHYRIDADLSPLANPPGIEQYFTHVQSAGCNTGVWPEGSPGAGLTLIGVLVQRGGTPNYGASVVPIGNVGPESSCVGADIAGTEWTYLGSQAVNVNEYPQTMAMRHPSVASEPEIIRWGGSGGLGSTGPRSYQVAVAGLAGTCETYSSSAGFGNTGTVFPSHSITCSTSGYIFASIMRRSAGPADGSSAAYTFAARAPAFDLMQGYANSGFAPNSWFGGLRVEHSGTYSITLDCSAIPRNPGDPWSWQLAFFPDA